MFFQLNVIIELNVLIILVSLCYVQCEGVFLNGIEVIDVDIISLFWYCKCLSYVIFGVGSVVSEDESVFEVCFDNGEMLNFSKKSVYLYFMFLV